MLQCSVTFYDKPEFSNSDRQDVSQSDDTTESLSQPCYVSLANYKLAFFNDTSCDQAFYEKSVGELSASRDSNSTSLTLSQKHNDYPAFTIYATTSILEKIEQTCKEYSHEKVLWNPLMDTPYGRPKTSYLSNINQNSNFKGVITLLIIVTLFAKIKDYINNFKTYGILPPIDLGDNKLFLVLYAFGTYAFSGLSMIGIEKLAFKDVISNNIAAFLQSLNIALAFVFPPLFCYNYAPHVCLALLYVLMSLTLILKMISYAHFMHELKENVPKILQSKDMRKEASVENLQIIQKNANNLSGLANVKDVLYFYFAPVLVYQLWYPRTEKIDRRRAIRLGAEVVGFIILQCLYMNQFIIPVLMTSTEAFRTGSLLDKFESFLEASNTYVPYIMANFYSFFHVLPNFLAEVLRFANRDFYNDWWNNTSIRTFWNRWNLPVHRWCTRHIYYPMQKHGYSKTLTICAVFLFSGLMHEYFYCVPVRLVTYHSILGLFSQAPMIFLEQKYSKTFEKYRIGNIFMWVGFWCVTMSLGVITYRIKYLEVYGEN